MLEAMGFTSMEDLFRDIPGEVRVQGMLDLPEGKSELEVRRAMEEMAAKDHVFATVFRGAGAYRHYIPSMVKNVISKEDLQTAYTPYQAEISQGILQSIFEYQTMICELTGMDASNASVYDGASAAAEAIAMCRERKRKKAWISATVQPGVLETVKTYCFGNEMELALIPEKDGVTDVEFLKEHLDGETACVYIQHPNYYGNLEPAEEIGEIVHEAGAKYIMGVNPISLGVLKTPREYGADVAVGEGQPLGLPLAFGGPYLGFMTCVAAMTRKLPGRIVGQTVDEVQALLIRLRLIGDDHQLRLLGGGHIHPGAAGTNGPDQVHNGLHSALLRREAQSLRVLRPLGGHQDVLSAVALGKSLIDLLGDEGHEGMQQLQQRHQNVAEHVLCG